MRVHAEKLPRVQGPRHGAPAHPEESEVAGPEHGGRVAWLPGGGISPGMYDNVITRGHAVLVFRVRTTVVCITEPPLAGSGLKFLSFLGEVCLPHEGT